MADQKLHPEGWQRACSSSDLRKMAPRSLAVRRLQFGHTDPAAAIAARVSLPLRHATLLNTSPVAGLVTCRAPRAASWRGITTETLLLVAKSTTTA